MIGTTRETLAHTLACARRPSFSLGFIAMVEGNPAGLRERHEANARPFEAQGNREGLAKVRQGLVLVSFPEGGLGGSPSAG